MAVVLLLLSWGRRKAKNKGYYSSDMPTVADDVHSGRIRPRWLPRGLSAGIVIVGKLAMSSSLCRAGTIVSNEIVNVALEVRSSRGV